LMMAWKFCTTRIESILFQIFAYQVPTGWLIYDLTHLGCWYQTANVTSQPLKPVIWSKSTLTVDIILYAYFNLDNWCRLTLTYCRLTLIVDTCSRITWTIDINCRLALSII
jgi:hypothetical protein